MTITVKIGAVAMTNADVKAQLLGLGSCVGVILFNEDHSYAAIAHIMLPVSGDLTPLEVIFANQTSDEQKKAIYVYQGSQISTQANIWASTDVIASDQGQVYEKGASLVFPKLPQDKVVDYCKQVLHFRFAKQGISMLSDLVSMYHYKPTKAVIAGGAEMFANANAKIGERNGEEVKKTLEGMNIPIVAEDLGGSLGRTIHLNWDEKKVSVKTKKIVKDIYSW